MRAMLTCLVLVAAIPVFAQQRLDGWSVGGFASISQSIYLGEGSSVTALPGISYKRGNWTYGLNGVTGTVSEAETSKTKVLLRPRFFGLITTDASELAGINRNITADVGASWSYNLSPETSFELAAFQEVTGAHSGQELRIEVEQKVTFGAVPLWLSAGLTWQSDDLASYLYGVRSSEATAMRAAYAPGSVLMPSVSISSGYPLSKRAILFGSLSYELLPGEVASSPIVVRDDQLGLALGVNFSF